MSLDEQETTSSAEKAPQEEERASEEPLGADSPLDGSSGVQSEGGPEASNGEGIWAGSEEQGSGPESNFGSEGDPSSNGWNSEDEGEWDTGHDGEGDEGSVREDEEEEESGEDHQREDSNAVRQNVSGVTAGGNVEVTGVKHVYEASEKYILEPLSQKTINQLEYVYLRPASFKSPQRTLEDLKKSHVLVVHGFEHAGKLSTSIDVSTRLLSASAKTTFIYRRKPHEAGSLLEVVQSKKWIKESVVILEDGFKKNVTLSQLDTAELDQLTESLVSKESFLIITTELEGGVLDAISAPKLLVRASRLREILVKHLEFYTSKGRRGSQKQVSEVVLNLWGHLRNLINTPFHIDRFCDRLQELESPGEAEIEALARSVSHLSQRAMRSWFDGLTSNEKTVAMMIYLLEGLDSRSLEDLATQAVFQLRAEGFLWVQDPREIGFKSLLETIRAHAEQGEIEFEDSGVKEEIAWQIGNRQGLLWSVLQPVVAKTSSSRMWTDPVRRASLGTAMGRLGVTDLGKFQRSLDFWAQSRGSLPRRQGDGIAALAGYAMSEALRRAPESQAEFQLAKLKEWIGSKDTDLVWTAGAAIWRIYHVILNQLEPCGEDGFGRALKSRLRGLLRELVRASGRRPYEIGEEIRDCAIFALERIGRADTAELVEILLEWMHDREVEHLRSVAYKAAQRSFKAAIKLDIESVAEKYSPLLGLIGGIFATTGGATAVSRSLCRFLAAWLQWDFWRGEIRLALLDVANRGACRTRVSLREALSHHGLQGVYPRAEEISQAVIARSYAMEGILTDRPILGRCIVVLDPELFDVRAAIGKEKEAETEVARRKGALQQVLAAIEVHMEVSVVLLGDGSDAPGEAEGEKWRLTCGYPVQRLMIPGFQTFAAEEVRMVLVVTSGPVLDLEDALDSIAADTKIVVAAGCELDPSSGVELLGVGRTFSAKDVETVEKRLQDLWAETLVKIAPETWLPLLEDLGVHVEHLDRFEDSLEAWAGRLGDLDGATGRTDLAKRIICVLFWLAAGDFEACLRIVRRWLTEGEETGLRRHMGAAAGFALFRAATDAPTAWGELTSIHLFDELAGPLGRFGQDGINAVLRAVERWLADPVLAAGLAGSVEDGRGRLLRWAEELAPQKLEFFQAALDRLRSAVDKEREDLGRIGEAFESILERLPFRFAMGRPRSLPNLEEGERYGVIVLDATTRQSGGGARWAQLASALFARFNGEAGDGLKPVLYRLGERWPAWVAGDPNPAAVDLSFDGFRLPRLLGPILASGLSPDQVDFMIVFADEAWIDGEDWIDTPWRERIVTYRQLQDAPWGAVFSTLPSLQEKDAVERLSQYLRQQFAGREEHRNEN